MVDSKNITSTDARLKSNLSKTIKKSLVNYDVEGKINKAVNDSKIRTGKVLKFYPFIDKAEVKLFNSNRTVLCKILLRFGGEMIDLYSPLADRWEFDDKLKERYIVPRSTLYVVVIGLHDEDSKEYLLLGFYENDELVGLNPAKPGNFKIVNIGGTNQYWIKFGVDGLDLRLPSKSSVKTGIFDEEMEDVNYPLANDVYTKAEVDKLIEDLRNELIND